MASPLQLRDLAMNIDQAPAAPYMYMEGTKQTGSQFTQAPLSAKCFKTTWKCRLATKWCRMPVRDMLGEQHRAAASVHVHRWHVHGASCMRTADCLVASKDSVRLCALRRCDLKVLGAFLPFVACSCTPCRTRMSALEYAALELHGL